MKEEQNLDKIAKYLSDNMGSDEREELFAWVKKKPGNQKLLEDSMEVWEAAAPTELAFQPNMEAAWAKMDKRLETARENAPATATVRLLLLFRPWMRMAAAAVVVLGLGWWLLTNQATGAFIETKTLAQEKTTITLPDGTEVWLNQNSSLKYEKHFDRRVVYLEGEAYFDVAKMNGESFEVFAGPSKTSVLGTEFNVRAYPNEGQVEIAVEEGKVNFSAKNNPSENANLIEGDFAVLGAEKAGNGTKVVKEAQAKLNAAGWKKAALRFEETKFTEVEEALERYYGVEVNIDAAIADCTFTMGEVQEPILEEILEAISFTTNDAIQFEAISEEMFRLTGSCK